MPNKQRGIILSFSLFLSLGLVWFSVAGAMSEVENQVASAKEDQSLQPEISLDKMVGLDPLSCGTAEFLEIPAGTEVTYCYEVTNTGTISLLHHELIDSELGTILDSVFDLIPGESSAVTQSVTIEATTVNSATWTASNPGPSDIVSATDTVTVTVVPAALIAVNPQSLSSVQGPDEQVTFTLVISNLGDAVLEWSVFEEDPVQATAPTLPGHQDMLAPASDLGNLAVISSRDQCAEYATYVGAEPVGYAEICLRFTQAMQGRNLSPSLDPDDIAYALDLRHDNFVWHYLNNFPGQTFIASQPAALYGLDFDNTGQNLYALNDLTRQLGTINVNNGIFTPVGSSIPGEDETFTGLTIHPITNEAYASTSDGDAGRLYSIDLSNGWLTLIYSDTSIPLLIDIAINPSGVLYGHDLSTDSIYILDPIEGKTTLVGPTGVEANFAQGMDFDNYDGTLYAWIYWQEGANQYGTIDLETGAFTLLAANDPLGEFEGTTLTPLVDSCDKVDINWLGGNPGSGFVAPGQSQAISVTLDSTALTSGIHQGTLCIESNDFFRRVMRVPVTLEVESVAGISLRKTVGLDPNVCATTDVIEVAMGTRVYYCFKVTNTGSVPFKRQDLVDSHLGTIFDNLGATLQPGASLAPIIPAVLYRTTINTATWTSYNPGPTEMVADSDSATVLLPPLPYATFEPIATRP